MPDTERLHDKIRDAEIALARIERDCAALQRAVDALLSDFAMKHPGADVLGLSSDFNIGLSTMQDEMNEPHLAAKSEADDELDDIEWRDMERSRAMVL